LAIDERLVALVRRRLITDPNTIFKFIGYDFPPIHLQAGTQQFSSIHRISPTGRQAH
jgi:hypothetical protein